MADKYPVIPEAKPVAVRSSAAPLGLLCFGVTTMIAMSMHTGWTEKAVLRVVLGYALFYGGASQLIAGILELIRGNTFGGTAFTSYGAFWMGYFIVNSDTLSTNVINKGALPDGMSYYLGVWGLLTFCFFCLTLKKPLLIQLVFGTLTMAFVLLAAGVRHPDVDKAGGYMGMLCGFLAFYTAFAELVLEEYEVALPGLHAWYKAQHQLPA